MDSRRVDVVAGSNYLAANNLVHATHVVLIKKLMANFNPNHKIVLDNLLLTNPLFNAGKMFGFPAYYVNNKLCICLYEQGLGGNTQHGESIY
ncbi:MAG: hypothetical protein KKC20_25105 [Proteobacteria bacterium]|nr:hypothetical protein [Pseudomonadota bacterium]